MLLFRALAAIYLHVNLSPSVASVRCVVHVSAGQPSSRRVIIGIYSTRTPLGCILYHARRGRRLFLESLYTAPVLHGCSLI